MRVGAVQMASAADKAANLEAAARLIRTAVSEGAELCVLPEMFNVLGSSRVLREGAEPLDGLTAGWAADQARAHGIWLVAGSFIEQAEDEDRRYNTSCVFAPDGARVAVYRKIHLFDVDVPGAEFHESEVTSAGSEIVVCPTALTGESSPEGVPGTVGVGMAICYDLRFPELFRIATLRGADIMALPAAFTATTGPPHWEILVRARAIEDQVFMIAAGQCGKSSDKLAWHGHSLIVDPWGTVLAAAADDPTVLVADLDFEEQKRIRRVMPSVDHRRPVAYTRPLRVTAGHA